MRTRSVSEGPRREQLLTSGAPGSNGSKPPSGGPDSRGDYAAQHTEAGEVLRDLEAGQLELLGDEDD
jgi:hypothetical protein